MKKSLLCLTLCFCGLIALAQTAHSFLQVAMQRCGQWHDVQTLDYTTIGLNYNKWQNYSFHKPRPTKDEAIRSYDFAGKAYYIETVSRYGGGYVFRFANIGKDTSRYQYDKLQSRNGKVLSTGGKGAFDAGLLLVNETFPFYVFKTILASNDSLVKHSDNVIRRYLKGGTYEELAFTGYDLVKVSRNVNGVSTEKVFAKYKTQKGLRYPETVSNFSNNELVRIDKVKKLAINKPFNPSLLVIPEAYKTTTTAPAGMKVSEISKDVYLIEAVPGGRNVLFVNMTDGIVVTEAPLSTEVSRSVIDLIHKTLPGIPISYVHLSHFHNDHSHGIRAFVSEGATVLATFATIAAIKTVIDDTGRNDALSKLNVMPLYLPFDKTHVLKDATHEIHFYQVNNMHAEGLSFLYLPNEKIIYQGDLYSLPDDGTITPAFEITRDFHRFIKSRKLAVQRIIGHHGSSNITMEVLQAAVGMKNRK